MGMVSLSHAAKHLIKDLASLLYVPSCLACRTTLMANEDLVCDACMAELALPSLMPAADLVDGRPGLMSHNLKAYWVLAHFEHGNAVQRLLHKLKYGDRPKLGLILGQYLGANMLLHASEKRPLPDVIIPVPLDAAGLRKRGYNQAGMVAAGISNATGIPLLLDVLIRPKTSESQVRRSREERLQAMATAFTTVEGAPLSGQHILLVDDVLTTGSTLGACASALTSAGASHLSIAVLAAAGS